MSGLRGKREARVLPKAWPVAAALAIVGCSAIPDVTVSYYFPRANTQFALTQTLGCSPKADGRHRIIHSAVSVNATTSNSADLDWKNDDGSPRQGHIRYRAFSGTFSDADATVTLTPDGRLAGINATGGGQGSTIVKNLVSVAGTVAPLLAPAAAPAQFVETVEDKACDQIDTLSAVTAAAAASTTVSLVTLTYTVTITYKAATGIDPTFAVETAGSASYDDQSGDRTSISFAPDATSKPTHDALKGILGDRLSATLKMISTKSDLRIMTATTPVTVTPAQGFAVELNKVALVNLEIDGHAGDNLESSKIWSGAISVPMRETYQVPIPSPPTFGKTAFGIGLSDNGSIISLHYGETNGTPDATDAAGQIAQALRPKAAEDAKAQADLVAEQQRLVGCEVSVSACK
jgi:hypothetical protein